jgi:hypothetical protein
MLLLLGMYFPVLKMETVGLRNIETYRVDCASFCHKTQDCLHHYVLYWNSGLSSCHVSELKPVIMLCIKTQDCPHVMYWNSRLSSSCYVLEVRSCHVLELRTVIMFCIEIQDCHHVMYWNSGLSSCHVSELKPVIIMLCIKTQDCPHVMYWNSRLSSSCYVLELSSCHVLELKTAIIIM